MRFLGHNMHIDVRCFAEQFLDGHEVKIVTPPSNRRSTQNNLRDAMLFHKIGDRSGDFASLDVKHSG